MCIVKYDKDGEKQPFSTKTFPFCKLIIEKIQYFMQEKNTMFIYEYIKFVEIIFFNDMINAPGAKKHSFVVIYHGKEESPDCVGQHSG